MSYFLKPQIHSDSVRFLMPLICWFISVFICVHLWFQQRIGDVVSH